jgi:hypothetical protein
MSIPVNVAEVFATNEVGVSVSAFAFGAPAKQTRANARSGVAKITHLFILTCLSKVSIPHDNYRKIEE